MLSQETIEWLLRDEYSIYMEYMPEMEIKVDGDMQKFDSEFRLHIEAFQFEIKDVVEIVSRIEKEGWKFCHMEGGRHKVSLVFTRGDD